MATKKSSDTKGDLKDMAKTYVAVRAALYSSDKKKEKQDKKVTEELNRLKEEQRELAEKNRIASLLTTPSGRKELEHEYERQMIGIETPTAEEDNLVDNLAEQTVIAGQKKKSSFTYTSKHLASFLHANPEVLRAFHLQEEFYNEEKEKYDNDVLEHVFARYKILIASFEKEKETKAFKKEYARVLNLKLRQILNNEKRPIPSFPNLLKEKNIVSKENIQKAKKAQFKTGRFIFRSYSIVSLAFIIFFSAMAIGGYGTKIFSVTALVLIILYVLRFFHEKRTFNEITVFLKQQKA